jgi:hypothetical protein
MPNRSLWNWTLIIGAIVAIVGVGLARLLEVLLPSNALNVVVVAFFSLCVLGMGALIYVFVVRRT